MRHGTIVIADDEARQREALARALRAAGHEAIAAGNGQDAVRHVRERTVDVVLTDLRMPDLDGLGVLRSVHAIRPDVAVIVMTAYGSVGNAVEAMKAGAADYLTKPVELDELEMLVERALERRDLVRENRTLRQRLERAGGGFRLLGDSPALQELLARSARAAATDATVLVRGESGTGKELLARSIHDLSRRAAGPFVPVNCAALPETLLESELFGHEKGAFTGAAGMHRGRIEQAAGGTLFLDEIGDVPATMQVKLLRFLQDREFTRLGGEAAQRADVRLVAATHRDLQRRIVEGAFREDLFYRLNVITLEVPPLRERREDIPALVEQLLARAASRHELPVRALSREAMDAVLKHDFPGNVRELENALEQATVLATGDVITLSDLPTAFRAVGPGSDPVAHRPALDLASRLDDIERGIVIAALEQHAGNQSRAARALGITEGGLRYKLRKWFPGASAGGGDAGPEFDSS